MLAHHANAIAAGARCTECPLYGGGAGPVPPCMPAEGDAGFVVVGEFPNPAEVEQGIVGVGPAAREVKAALTDAGVNSDSVSYTHAMLCRPPQGDLDGLLRELKKTKQASPLACCKPRLSRELARARFALYTGKAAAAAAGVDGAAMTIRGTPIGMTDDRPPGLATMHPSYVTADSGKVMRGVFRHDVAKAVRLAGRVNRWTDPPYIVNPPTVVLEQALADTPDGAQIAVDTETDGIDAWTCGIRRIGIGTAEGVIIWAPMSVDGTRLMDAWTHDDQLKNVLAPFFARPLRWYFHNFYGFDSIVLAQHGLTVNETNLFDSLIGHHVGASSELPHTLAFLGSIYTDAPYWKDIASHEKEDK